MIQTDRLAHLCLLIISLLCWVFSTFLLLSVFLPFSFSFLFAFCFSDFLPVAVSSVSASFSVCYCFYSLFSPCFEAAQGEFLLQAKAYLFFYLSFYFPLLFHSIFHDQAKESLLLGRSLIFFSSLRLFSFLLSLL